jgi:hypothetical protein
MKASELIHRLQSIVTEFGDIDVRLVDDSLPVMLDVAEVTYPKSGPPYVILYEGPPKEYL